MEDILKNINNEIILTEAQLFELKEKLSSLCDQKFIIESLIKK